MTESIMVSPALGEFTVEKKEGRKRVSCVMYVTDGGVTWRVQDHKSDESIPLTKLLTVTIKDAPSKGDKPCASLTLHYINIRTKLPGIIIRKETKEFFGPREVLDQCAAQITDLLKKDTTRPKQVLLILNPGSGSSDGKRVYDKVVGPLFELVGVQAEVIESKSPAHIGEIIDDYDLSTVHVIVAMGGDGTVTLVCSALLKRCQKEAAVDLNDPECDLVRPSVPVAHLPTGTGNGISNMTFYSRDIETCALALILGHKMPKDITTIHSGGKFVEFSSLLFGYGMFASMVYSSERKRWMGKFRYVVVLTQMIKGPPTFDVEIDYLPYESETWLKYSGPAVAVQTLPHISITNTEYNNSGNMSLSWMKPCTFKERYSFFSALMKEDEAAYEREYVGHSRVTRVRVKGQGPWSETKMGRILDWDGEVLELPEAAFDVSRFSDVCLKCSDQCRNFSHERSRLNQGFFPACPSVICKIPAWQHGQILKINSTAMSGNSMASPALGEFTVEKKEGRRRVSCVMYVTDGGVTWRVQDHKADESIPLTKLLTVTVKDAQTKGDKPCASLTLHYINICTKLPGVIIRKETQEFFGPRVVLDQCAAQITDLLNKDTARPKHVLLILNPGSGSSDGKREYDKVVGPLFELVGVQAEVIESKSPAHISEIIEDCDLSTVHVIVAMGGDGTVTLICSALLKRCQKEAGVDLNDPECDLVRPSVPVAHLPTGTGNGTASMTFYSRDIETCALALVLGHKIPKDVCAINSGGKFLEFSTLLLGYGIFAAMMYNCERKRWLGRLRYMLVFTHMFKRPPTFDVDIDYLPYDSDTWLKYSGPAVAVQTFPHLGITNKDFNNSGNMSLSWMKPCTMKERFSFFVALMKQDESWYEREYLGHSYVTRFCVKSQGPWSETKMARMLDWDGEVVELPEAAFDVRVHPGLIDMIGLDNSLAPSDLFEGRQKSGTGPACG